MSLEAITWALKQDIQPAVRKLILIKLCDNADEETGLCFPSVANIAKVAGCDARTAQRHLAELINLGYVTVVERGGTRDGVRRANTFRVTQGWNGRSITPRQNVTPPPGTMSGDPPAECQGSPGTLPEQPVIEPVIKEPDRPVARNGRRPKDIAPGVRRPTEQDIDTILDLFEQHLPKLTCPNRARLKTVAATYPMRGHALLDRWRTEQDMRDNPEAFFRWMFRGMSALPDYRGDARSGFRPKFEWLFEEKPFGEVTDEVEALAKRSAA